MICELEKYFIFTISVFVDENFTPHTFNIHSTIILRMLVDRTVLKVLSTPDNNHNKMSENEKYQNAKFETRICTSFD